jgi:UDP:flavonoid glycosyltransferase YjiC (YdhE family)
MSADDRKWRFGVLSFTGTGHLNPLFALSQELQRRGHRVTFFEKPKIEDRVRQAGLNFVPLRTGKFPSKRSAPSQKSGILADISTLRFNLARVRFEIEQYLKETPSALDAAGIDALLINEIALTGPTVAQLLRLPYFLIATTLPHHFGWSGRSCSGSSWLTGHRGSTSWISWLESHCLELSALRTRGPIRRALDADRRKLGLGPVGAIPKDFPCLAHITQLPQCLDFEHVAESAGIYYSGPWISTTARAQVAFPWDRIDGRPLIYATLGTTRNVQPSVFRMIAQACADLNLQLVIALGNRMDPELLAGLPGEPLVVRFAPQLELIKLARVVISHAGPNTSFEALIEGKPMIVIPLAYDQPAIAARLAHFRIAEVLPFKRLSAHKLRAAVTNVLNDSTYAQAAQKMRNKLRSVDGTRCAADIISVEMEGYAVRRQLILRSDECCAGEQGSGRDKRRIQGSHTSLVSRSSARMPS